MVTGLALTFWELKMEGWMCHSEGKINSCKKVRGIV